MSEKYKYLFPYEKIPQGSYILIYGAGDVGQEYLQQMLMTKYASVVGFIDRAWDKYPSLVVPLYPPEKAAYVKCDYIVLAFKMATYADDVRRMLVKNGVDNDKIIFQGARHKVQNLILSDTNTTCVGEKLAFEKSKLTIALKYGPGLGDAIIKKHLFMEIVKKAPTVKIDIYSPNASVWIPTIYRDMPNFNCAIDDGGMQYINNQHKYALAMSIFFLIQLDHVNYSGLEKECLALAEMARTIEQANAEYNLSLYPNSQNEVHFRRSIFKKRNCFNIYNYTGAFNLNSMNVPIPLDKLFIDKYLKLGLGKYITINYGNGATSKGQKAMVSKQWPKEYFDELSTKIKEKYHSVTLVQLGDKTADVVDNIDKCILGEDLELVKYILRGSLLHIDIEGGLMHLATQLGTKCICLLGPTYKELFSYPQNINLVSSKCSGCYCLYDNSYRCARDMDKPECMYDITPEQVMLEVEKYLEGIGESSL